jgi:predicted Zn finger-like uncharacterized protein
MRFVCDSCRAQYMISDDKVGPKGVKVRCKKCSHVILVRKAAEAPLPQLEDEQATQVMQNPLLAMNMMGANGGGAHANGGGSGGAAAGPDPGLFGSVDEDEIGAVFDQVLGGPTEGDKGSDAHAKNGNGAGEDEDGIPNPSTEDWQNTRVIDAEMVRRLAQASVTKADPESRAPKAVEAVANAEWFVAIDEKQVGPLNLDKLKEHWEQGQIGPDSLCWRAGLSDWMPLSEISELASVLAPKPQKPVIVSPAPVVKSSPTPSAPIESAFSAGRGGGAGMAAAAMGPSHETETSGSWKPSAASALASLVNEELGAMKQPPKVPAAAASAASSGGGLLDLPEPSNPGINGHAVRRLDEPRRYGEDVSSAGYIPARQGSSKGVIIAVLLTLVVVGGAGGGYFFWKSMGEKGKSDAVATAPSTKTAADVPMPPPPVPKSGSSSGPAASPLPPKGSSGGGTDSASTDTGSGAVAKVDRPRRRREASDSSGGTSDSSGGGEGEEFVAPGPKTGSGKPVGKIAEDEFDKVFGGGGGDEKPGDAAPKKERKPTVYVPPAPGGADIPETLGQSDIMQVVLQNRPAIKKCVDDQKAKDAELSGTLVMRLTVKTSGRADTVVCETDEFKTSPLAGCMISLIKSWSWPKHKVQGDPVKIPIKF